MITPVGFLVLVRPDAPKEKLKNDRIIIPDAVLEKERIAADTGVIVAIGSKAWQDQADGGPWAKVGDHILYAKYGGKVYIDPDTEEKLVVIQDKDVLGVL